MCVTDSNYSSEPGQEVRKRSLKLHGWFRRVCAEVTDVTAFRDGLSMLSGVALLIALTSRNERE